MLAKDIHIVDLGADSFSRLLGLVNEFLEGLRPGEGTGPLLVIYRGLKLLKAIDLGRGRPVSVDFYGTSRLEMLSDESGYPKVIALEESAVARIVGHGQRKLNYDDDYFKQVGGFLQGIAREWGKTVFTYPPGPARLITPPHWMFEGAFRLLIPDDTVLLLLVTEKGDVWTSVVVGYRDGDFWLLTSLDTVSLDEGDVSGGSLGFAADLLGSKYGGTVRVMAIEREALRGIPRSRFPAGALLWALNTGDLRLIKVPWRWRILALLTALAATNRSRAPA